MNIIFLNTWHSKMQPELSAYIQGVAATVDVFCFTEAFDEDLYVYETLLTDFEQVSAQKQQGTLHFGNVMYVRKTLRITGIETFFEEEPGVGFAHAVTFEKDNRENVVCSVHGIPYPGDKLDTPERLHQTATLLGAFADRSRVVIGGDFNLLPETQSIRKFAANGYRDLIADYGVETTRNYLSFGKHPESPQYFADYAFTSSDVNVKDFIVPAVIVSDHQPLELSID